MHDAAIRGPRLADESDVQADEHAVAGPFLQFLPVNSLTRGRERNALNAAALNTFGNAAVDISMKAEIVGVDEKIGVIAWSGPRGNQ
jgi:hypothetical protein